MATSHGKHRKKKQDLPERVQPWLRLLSDSLLAADDLLKLIELIRSLLH